MLLSLLSQLQAINMRNSLEMSMMRNSQRRMDMLSSAQSFGSNMNSVFAAENKMDLENAKNATLYQMVCAQEEANKKRIAKDIERTFNIFA